MGIEQFLQHYSFHDGEIIAWVQKGQAWLVTIDCFDPFGNRSKADVYFEEVRSAKEEVVDLLNAALEQGQGVGILAFEIQKIGVGFRVRFFFEMTHYLEKEQSYLRFEGECQAIRVLKVIADIMQ